MQNPTTAELTKLNFIAQEILDELRSIRSSSNNPRSRPRVLPDEILGEILAHLCQNDVAPFLRVSRALNRIARIRLWRRIYVSPSDAPQSHKADLDRKYWSVVKPYHFISLLQNNALGGCEELVLCDTEFSSRFYHEFAARLSGTDIRIVNSSKKGPRKPGQMFNNEFSHDQPELTHTSLEVALEDTAVQPIQISQIASCRGWSNLRHLTLRGLDIEPGESISDRCRLDTLICGGMNLENIRRYVDLRTVKQFMLTSQSDRCTEIAQELTSCTHLCLIEYVGPYIPDWSIFLGALPKDKLRFFRIHKVLSRGATVYRLRERLVDVIFELKGAPLHTFVSNVSTEIPVAPWVTFLDPPPDQRGRLEKVGSGATPTSMALLLDEKKINFPHLVNLVLDGDSFHIAHFMGEWLHADSEKYKREYFYASGA
ncbi:hypothetical protein DICA1_C17568 [Diutina catenulata]